MILATGFCAAQLQSTLDEGPFSLNNLDTYKQALAIEMVAQLQIPEMRATLAAELSENDNSLALVPFLQKVAVSREIEAFQSSVTLFDSQIREIKGIADRVDNLLEIHLAFPEMGLTEDFLVAATPSKNEKAWEQIEAYDLKGKVHYLDPVEIPLQQVLVIGLDARKDMRAGLELMNEELRKAGMQTSVDMSRAGLKVAKLDYIRLNDDQEPWLLGDAEIYTMVNGISTEAAKANIIAAEMPYLVTDDKDYYPNQVLVVWDNYRFKAANLNVYEHDDSTSYKELVATIIEKIGAVVPEYAAIMSIAAQIIRLMPDAWFTNDDDYVDVYYTLEDKPYVNFYGVSNNAKITLKPYTLNE
jgi:hypothetical protein